MIVPLLPDEDELDDWLELPPDWMLMPEIPELLWLEEDELLELELEVPEEPPSVLEDDEPDELELLVL